VCLFNTDIIKLLGPDQGKVTHYSRDDCKKVLKFD